MSFNFKKLPIVNITIIVLVSAMAINMGMLKLWKKETKVIYWDAVSYYAYLPATFIYGDVTLKFKEDYDGEYEYYLWAIPLDNGNQVIKTTMGLSYLYSPWFFLGHTIAQNTDYDASGFTEPYKITLQFGVLVYFLIGLFFLSKVLLRYFNKWITSFSIILICLGSNLYNYIVSDSTVSHSYSFVLISIFLWLVIKWHQKKNLKYTILIGLSAGLITLIRPSNIIVLLILFLWKINSLKEIKNRIYLFLREYKKVLLMILLFIIVWIPQMIYWKKVTGELFYYSYGEEGFFFLQPKFFKALFSYRSGWLVYSPIMILSIIGIPFMLKQKEKEAFVPVTIYTFINMWIIFSWWCWWWGGSLGIRPLIDSYPLLAIPFASIINYFYKKKSLLFKIAFTLILLLFTFYGIHMTRKYFNRSIHYDGMTKSAFWYNFWQVEPKDGLYNLIEPANYERAKKGLDQNPFGKLHERDFNIMIFDQLFNNFTKYRIPEEMKFYMKSSENLFVSTDKNNDYILKCNRKTPRAWEKFSFIPYENNVVKIRTYFNTYLSSERSNPDQTHIYGKADKWKNGNWFYVEWLTKNTFLLRTGNQPVWINDNKELQIVNEEHVKPSLFTVVDVPKK